MGKGAKERVASGSVVLTVAVGEKGTPRLCLRRGARGSGEGIGREVEASVESERRDAQLRAKSVRRLGIVMVLMNEVRGARTR